MATATEHPNNPANQPFNVAPRKNLTKSRTYAWWGHPPYNNNGAVYRKKQTK